MKQRLDNPKAYFVFYEYFYKAAVGETRWKETLEKTNDEEQRFGNDSTEAFAHILLYNNYDAWLFAVKNDLKKELRTEYDTIPSPVDGSMLEMLLDDVEFDLEGEGELLTGQKTDRMTLQKHYNRRLLIQTQIYESHKENAVGKPAPLPLALAEANQIEGDKYEQTKKKRKLMKDLKRFTGTPTAEERRFKGWSDSGHKAFQEMTKQIKQDVEEGKYKKWERLYKEYISMTSKTKEQEDDKKKPFQVDKGVVWEF